MLKLHYHPAPNPFKVALFLEEAELPYTLVPCDIRNGDQHRRDFLALNPNAKTPVLEDDGVVVFDSNAILLYLAEKTGRFLPAPTSSARAESLSWLMFVATGVGPYSGQAVHFRHYAPPLEYAVNRYVYEARRHYAILDARLEEQRYLVGDSYTYVDMAAWGWARLLSNVLPEAEGLGAMPHLKRWLDEINARPAAARVDALKQRHPFKTQMDDQARRHLFPHNK